MLQLSFDSRANATILQALISPPMEGAQRDPLKKELILKSFVACPDIIQPFLDHMAPLVRPRDSDNWFQLMEFLIQVNPPHSSHLNDLLSLNCPSFYLVFDLFQVYIGMVISNSDLGSCIELSRFLLTPFRLYVGFPCAFVICCITILFRVSLGISKFVFIYSDHVIVNHCLPTVSLFRGVSIQMQDVDIRYAYSL